MIGQVQLAVLLVVAVFIHSDAAPFADEQSPPSITIFEYSVILDEQFDKQLPALRSFILKNGLDPMDSIDISESILPDLPGIFKGLLELKNGWIQNIAQVKRTGHVIAKYNAKMLVLEMDLGFDVIDATYKYHIEYLLLDRKGDLNCRLHDLKTKVLLTVDLSKYHATLNSIKFTEVGKYDITFEGNLLDPILNVATKLVTSIFKKYVLQYIEERTMQIFRAKVDEWNKLISCPNSTHYDNTLNVATLDTIINTLDLKLD